MSPRAARWLYPLALALAGGCSSDEAPRKGQVMVALATDMSVPKDISVIRVKAKLGAEVRYEYDFRIAPDGEFHVPGTIAVVEGSTPTPVVTVEVIGILQKKAGSYEPRTFAKAITTIPRERTVLLQMPVQWLCDDSVIDDGTGEYLTSCSDDPMTGEETACVAGTCQSVHIDSSKLPTYNPRDVYGGGSTPTDPAGHCFDTLTCFDDGYDLTAAEVDGDGDCAVEFPDDGAEYNFALTLSSAGDGICHGDSQSPPCFVPLDQDERLGWQWASKVSGGLRKAIFPPGVCKKLDSGLASTLRVTTSCQTKTSQFSTCGAWSTLSTPLPPPTVTGSGGRGGGAGTGGTGAMDLGGAGADTAGTGDTAGQSASVGGASGKGGSAGLGGTAGTTGSAGDTGAGGTQGGAGGASATGGSAGDMSAAGGPAGDAGTGATGGNGGSGGASASACPGNVTFPDTHLDGLIREALGKQPAVPITGAEVAALTNLFATGNTITDLSGMECLTGLTTLHLDNNLITDLTPLAGLTGLTYLDISTNQIASTAPLAALTKVTQLIANHNPLTDITGLTALTGSIDLNNCGLTDISALSGATSTTWLYLSDNQLTSVSPLAGLTQLQGLGLARNPGLTSISSLSGLTNLITFGFDTSPITDISAVAGMTKLIDLEMVDCAIADFSPLAGLTAMQQLYITNTGIADLTPLKYMTGLTMLLAGQGNVTDLSPLAGLPLQYLELQTNLITDLTPLASVPTLLNVNLSYNSGITDLSPLTGLTSLQLLNTAYTSANSLQPLIDNPGLASGDFLVISGMPLCSAQDTADIATLEGRGVTVTFYYGPC